MATFKGKVSYVSESVGGTSKAGKEWSKIDVALVYDNAKPEYPREVLFSVMNDNIEKFGIRLNGEYEVEIDFSVREYNGKRYMSATAWKCTPLAQAASVQAPQVTPAPQVEQEEDLPF